MRSRHCGLASRALTTAGRAILLVVIAACARAPELRSPAPEGAASTDVYLYRFSRFPLGSAVFNITNRKGYDNQPSWDGNRRILYTSQSAGQTDIYEINFETSTIGKVTDTPESEYSAALTPDGNGITVVRVERDSAQRLWRFPKDRSAPTVVLPEIKPVGYYAWLDTTQLALFVLGTPNTLRIADTRTGETRIVTTDIGRSLQRVPGGNRAAYLHRVGPRWMLETVDPTPRPDGSFPIDTIAAMPDSADYVVWKHATELYTAVGSRIYRMRLPNKTWLLVDDLASSGIRRISRIAMSPDGSRLALVADEPAPNP
jgi:WD40-like Beta Propeller Repeat